MLFGRLDGRLPDREVHIGPGIPVGDRKNVQIVEDLAVFPDEKRPGRNEFRIAAAVQDGDIHRAGGFSVDTLSS